MADWATIAEVGTAAGTLVLATATFASVRSANRSARLAELALQEQRRPVLVQSRTDDRDQAIGFADGRWVSIPGGGAVVEATTEAVYLAVSLRNVGAGLAVLQGWRAHSVGATEPQSEAEWRGLIASADVPPDVEDFRSLTRDQYIASGDIGFWQGAVREPDDPLHVTLTSAASARHRVLLDLLYTDQVGGQRTISRFGLLPGDEGGHTAAAARHWYLDAPAPR
ncbi:MAG TPA: hypothetical protein VKG89_01660 [Solirubrobacterales bacterium]|nr:hypothetical protein [Solirubrobacterales bacterium]